MCLLVNDITKDEKIAKTTITVYKILRKEDEEYKTPFVKVNCKIGETLKSASFSECILSGQNPQWSEAVSFEGAHAFKSLFAARHCEIPYDYKTEYTSFYITEWEIPKGAIYWEGVRLSCLEIAATEMKFIKVIEQCKPQDDFLLRAYTCSDIDVINEFATHYITDEGDVKPIKKGQKVDKWQLCWSVKSLKKLIPETITYDDEEFKLIEIQNTKENGYVEFSTIGYQNQNKRHEFLACGTVPTTDKGFLYGRLLRELIKKSLIDLDSLKKKVQFTIVNP